MLENLTNWTAMYGVNGRMLKPVEVAQWDGTTSNTAMDNIEIKACFNNSYHLVESLFAYKDICYVLGYAVTQGIPIEHAWIKMDGIYYDLTWQKFSSIGEKYYSLIEFDHNELFNFVLQGDNSPPSVDTILRYYQGEYDDFINIKYRDDMIKKLHELQNTKINFIL